MFVDTHCHIIWDKLKGREAEVVQAAKDAGVEKMITIGCDLVTSEESKNCAEAFDEVFFTVGLHPCDAETETDWEAFEALIQHPKCKAVGECGFDFYYSRENEEKQKEVFIKQINLAKKYNKPLIIHTRDAGKEILEILKSEQVQNFVIHCFTETTEFAKEILALGGMVSFGGILTFPGAKDLRETFKVFPLDRIMLETDAPYLAPQKVRGTVNEPKNIPEIAQKIADLKEVSLSEVEEQTTLNANQFFNI